MRIGKKELIQQTLGHNLRDSELNKIPDNTDKDNISIKDIARWLEHQSPSMSIKVNISHYNKLQIQAGMDPGIVSQKPG